jgi:hypothetical protein
MEPRRRPVLPPEASVRAANALLDAFARRGLKVRLPATGQGGRLPSVTSDEAVESLIRTLAGAAARAARLTRDGRSGNG